jgi:hypothetical protein
VRSDPPSALAAHLFRPVKSRERGSAHNGDISRLMGMNESARTVATQCLLQARGLDTARKPHAHSVQFASQALVGLANSRKMCVKMLTGPAFPLAPPNPPSVAKPPYLARRPL